MIYSGFQTTRANLKCACVAAWVVGIQNTKVPSKVPSKVRRYYFTKFLSITMIAI